MSSHVVIVESPAKCKTINKYLGKDYKVLASYGHIRDLPSKDGSVVPDEDFAMKYYVPKDSQKRLKDIKDAVKGAESLILATDPDREGEAISWHVYDALKASKAINANTKIQRVSFNSITKKAVTEAMENPRDLDMDLVNSQQARRALDYLVGFTLSPVLWRKLPGSKSAGRVQSVALRLICERETEIEKFIPQEYWSIKATFENSGSDQIASNLIFADGNKLNKLSIGKEGEAKKFVEEIKKQSFTVEKVEKKQVSRKPKPPFTTSTLQQEASRKLGFSASKTMMVAQKLYEGFEIGGETTGVITYMRTDGISIAAEALDRTRDTIQKKFGDKYLPSKPIMYKTKAKNAQEAHEAIRPTDPARTPESLAKYLDKDQFRLYELIWKRLMASQMENAILDVVSATLANEDKKYKFRATGNTLKFDGFYKLYREGIDDGEDEDKESLLPELKEGESVTLSSKVKGENPLASQHFTQPPPRFNEASLVKKLEELGIGRPSTYAAILSILGTRGYVRLEKRRFHAEVRGRLVTTFLEKFFSKYVEYDFTANLEDELDLVSDGKLDWKTALGNFWGDFKQNVDSAMDIKIEDVINHLDSELEPIFFGTENPAEKKKCPNCSNGTLGLKLGRYGAFLGCSNYPECKTTIKIETVLDGGDEAANGDNNQNNNAPKSDFETKVIAKDETTGLDITLRKGPYGFYLQLGEAEGKKKPKRQGLPKGLSPDDVDEKKAKALISLPINLGKHPETGEDITVSIGRYGPYVAHNKKFHSIKMDIFDVDLDQAISIIENDPKNKKK